MGQFQIAVFPGDGIGQEITQPCVDLLTAVSHRVGGSHSSSRSSKRVPSRIRALGSPCRRPNGGAAAADAILLGAMGLPDVRYPDGTEVAPHLDFRNRFQLYAGVRRSESYRVPTPLADPRARRIDCVLIRESTEGLFVSGHGCIRHRDEALKPIAEQRPRREPIRPLHAQRLCRVQVK